MVATPMFKEELHESAYLGVEECRQILFCSQLGLNHWMCRPDAQLSITYVQKLSSSSQLFRIAQDILSCIQVPRPQSLTPKPYVPKSRVPSPGQMI